MIPINGYDREEHDGNLHAKNVSLVNSNATIFAVVNTAAAGQASVVLDNSKAFIGLVTVANTVPTTFSGNVTIDSGVITTITNPVAIKGNLTIDSGNISLKGNVTLSDPKGFIGLVTVGGGTVGTTFSGNVTLDEGSKTGIVGNVTISDSKSFIGLVSVGGGILNTVTAVTDITNPVAIKGNLTISDSKAFIGLVTLGGGFTNIRGNVTLDVGSLVGIRGNVTLSDAKTFIGLTTSVALNGGTNRALDWKPVTLSTASILTVFTPTNANKVYVTNVLLSSDATVRVSIKSGVTYLTGNASIGVVLNPGGGWVERGSVDSPAYIGCASGPLIVEKFDMTGTKANVGGKVIYYSE